MTDWIKENAMVLIIVACLTGLAGFLIHNSYRLAIVRAEVDKLRAEEGVKLKFGTTRDRNTR